MHRVLTCRTFPRNCQRDCRLSLMTKMQASLASPRNGADYNLVAIIANIGEDGCGGCNDLLNPGQKVTASVYTNREVCLLSP